MKRRGKSSPTPRSRRSTKSQRGATKPCTREVSLYDGVQWIGNIKIAADGKSVAYDTRGKRLGSFVNFEAAWAAAFPKPKATSGAA
jgi:hypothetical protein